MLHEANPFLKTTPSEVGDHYEQPENICPENHRKSVFIKGGHAITMVSFIKLFFYFSKKEEEKLRETRELNAFNSKQMTRMKAQLKIIKDANQKEIRSISLKL